MSDLPGTCLGALIQDRQVCPGDLVVERCLVRRLGYPVNPSQWWGFDQYHPPCPVCAPAKKQYTFKHNEWSHLEFSYF